MSYYLCSESNMSEPDDTGKKKDAAGEIPPDEFSAMSPEELAAWARNAFEAISGNPEMFPGFPPELLKTLGENAADLEKQNRECDIALQRLALARAKRDRLAALYDTILADGDGPKDTQH